VLFALLPVALRLPAVVATGLAPLMLVGLAVVERRWWGPSEVSAMRQRQPGP